MSSILADDNRFQKQLYTDYDLYCCLMMVNLVDEQLAYRSTWGRRCDHENDLFG